jgi:predicted GNAT superfamily acetyltransferase
MVYMSKPGKKFDQTKIRWDLLPLNPIRQVVEVLTFGAKKYEPNNWQNVKDGINRYYGATLRHITDWREGEKLDQESGIHHLAHAICNLIYIIWIEAAREKKNKPRRKRG